METVRCEKYGNCPTLSVERQGLGDTARRTVRLHLLAARNFITQPGDSHRFFPSGLSPNCSRLRDSAAKAVLLAIAVLVPVVWAAVVYNASYTLNGGTATQTNQTYTSSATDQSAVWVTNSGVLTLASPTINTTSASSSADSSSQYGLNAAVLATASGKATLTDATITTTGLGANGLFATGSGSSLTMTNGSIKASGGNAHGVDVTYTGTITLTNVDITTTGASSSAIATDFGGGTVTVTGGTTVVSGSKSAGIYSTGNIKVTGATVTANADNGAVIDADGSIVITNVKLTGSQHGLMVHNTVGQQSLKGVFTVDGGSITAKKGDVFLINGATATVTAKGGATLQASTNNIVNSTSSATATFVADGETIAGNLVADSTSKLTATLQSGTTLTGMAYRAALTMDNSSKWVVTASSILTSLTNASGISGSTVTNITGNGNNVYYDSSLSANSYLNGQTYSLGNGGKLTPIVSGTTPAITSGGVANGASYAAGTTPGAWISIFGSNFASGTTALSGSDLIDGYLPGAMAGTSVLINGRPAYMYFVSPTQINVQAPDDASTGSVTVMVINSAGSASTTTTLQPVLPGLFMSSTYVLAVRTKDAVIINGTGDAASGYKTAAAANPGDVLELYATGLGSTKTAIPSGWVFSGAYPTTDTPTVAIGGKDAAVSFSGLVGPGLYQINVTVPSGLASGTYSVVVTQSGVSSPTTAMMKIAAN